MKQLSKKYKNIALICAFNNKVAQEKKAQLSHLNFVDLDKNPNQTKNVDLIIVLGGDGLMLHILHKYQNLNVPFYGVNCGTVGFLMNKDLNNSIDDAKESKIHPLAMDVIDTKREHHRQIAINEIALLRSSSQASKIKISVNKKERIDCLSGDGVLVSSPAGSTAYNLSCRGPIIPLDSNLLALTPISPFQPKNWHGAILPSCAEIEFQIIDPEKRPVSATADFIEVKNVAKIIVKEEREISFRLLFDANHSLEERIIREQFQG
jgi:NAD+ kinase